MDHISRLAWERLGIPQNGLEHVAVRVGLLGPLPPRPDLSHSSHPVSRNKPGALDLNRLFTRRVAYINVSIANL